MQTLWIDLETYSETDIRAGTDNYARDSEVMLFAYAIDDGPVVVWDLTKKSLMPNDLADALDDGAVTIVAHNATFEQAVLHHGGYGIDPSRYFCTMAQALAHGLPGGLDKLCDIFSVAEEKAKQKDGKALVQQFCKPQPKGRKLRRATSATHPEEWARFVEYCRKDVEAMRHIAGQMPNWNYTGAEFHLWQLDQKINRRGVPVDVELVNAALLTADRVKGQLAAEAQELTDGAVESTTQRNTLLRLLNEGYDLELEDLRASTVERLLKSDVVLPPVVVTLLENRLAASSTSVAKYKRFATLAGPDGRLRYTLQFCGASRTGRWAGRGVQLQNLPRPVLKQKAINAGIDAIKAGVADLLYDNTMTVLSSAVRGVIVAPPERKLVVADLSNIEGRMLAFLAGEEWKLRAFAEFDTLKLKSGGWITGDEWTAACRAGKPPELERDRKGEPVRKGHDLYALAYAKAFNVTPESVMDNKAHGDGSWRQIGKVMELALGYEGGVGAFVTFALAYGIDLDDMARGAIKNIPDRIRGEAEKAWRWAVETERTYGLSQLTYVVCDSFKRLWREAHPETSKFWKELETAVCNAIAAPGKVFTARKVRVKMTKAWLRIVLPSGRSLCYPSPRIDDNKITYMGVNQFSRKWNRLKTYSGKLAENVTQAASRDVIAHNLPKVEASGYKMLVTVHDEDITEAPDVAEYNADHLAALMATNPSWSRGLPLAAAGFEAYRYRKD